MKYYDNGKGELYRQGTPIIVNNVSYPDDILDKWSAESLAAIGFYEYVNVMPSITDAQKRIKADVVIENAKAVQQYMVSDKTETELIEDDVDYLRTALKMSRPRVITHLGFEVDGNREDLENFRLEYDYMVQSGSPTTTVRDADDLNHEVTLDDVKLIWIAIYKNAKEAMTRKWALKDKLKVL